MRFLIPRPWRQTVMRDLDEEARRRGKGTLWKVTQAARIGLRLQPVINGGSLMSDLRYAVRSLWRAKLFWSAAALTIGLGLATSIAVFTVVDRSLFRPFPASEPESLVLVRRGNGSSFPKTLFVDVRHGGVDLVDLAYSGRATSFRLPGAEVGTAPVRLSSASVNLLDVIGVAPVVGRPFALEDLNPDRLVALIAYEVWQSRFGGDPGVLGSELEGVRNTRVEIIGVLPPGFIAPTISATASSQGLVLAPFRLDDVSSREFVTAPVGRLKPGVSAAIVEEQLNALVDRQRQDDPAIAPERSPVRIVVGPIQPEVLWYNREYLWLAAVAASLVWLTAAVSFAGLLAVRGRARSREVALLAALGASRRRLFVAVLTEGAIVASTAGAVATLVTWWAAGLVRAMVPSAQASLLASAAEPRVWMFAVVSTLGAVAITGVPAWRATRVDLLSTLNGARAGSAATRWRLAGRPLLVAEVAVSIVLVTGAVVALRSLVGLVTTDVGYDLSGVQTVRVQLPTEALRSGAWRVRYDAVRDAVERFPGVTDVAMTDTMPASGSLPSRLLEFPAGRVGVWQASDGFLSLVKARWIAGRDFVSDDMHEGRHVAIVTRSASRLLWPEMEPEAVVGRALTAAGEPDRRVVGVVHDLIDTPFDREGSRIFVPLGDPESYGAEFAVRSSTRLNSQAFIEYVEGETGEAVVAVDQAGRQLRSALEQPKTQALVFSVFGLVALVVASVGQFAISAFDVAQRRSELGIRSALGATPRGLSGMVIRDALQPTLVGAVIGVALAYWASRFVQALLFGVDAQDPGTLFGVVTMLVLTTILAAWIPARRAGRVDPAVVLRAQ